MTRAAAIATIEVASAGGTCTFTIHAAARSVEIAGDMSGWQPVPLAPAVIVSHIGAVLVAVQVQALAAAVTPTVPVPAAALGALLVGASVNVHTTPACVTVNVCPAIVSVPVRGDGLGLAATA